MPKGELKAPNSALAEPLPKIRKQIGQKYVSKLWCFYLRIKKLGRFPRKEKARLLQVSLALLILIF